MIQDYEVDQILTDLPKAKPEEQAGMRQRLAEWKNQRQADESDKLQSVFTDPDGWGGQWTPEHQKMADMTIAPSTTKKGMANLRWIAAMEGKSTDDIADFIPSYRKAYAQKLFGKPDMGDDEFYGAVQTRVKGDIARQDGLNSLLGDVALNSFDDLMTGQQRPTAELVHKYKAENPDFFKGADEASVVSVLSSAYSDLQGRFQKYAVPAKMLFEAVTSQTGQIENKDAPTMGQAISELGTMTPEDRQSLYGAVSLAVKRKGLDPKSFWSNFGDALGRGTLGVANQAVRVTYADTLQANINAIEGGARWGTEDPKEREAIVAESKDKLNIIRVIREVSALAEQVDPTRSTAKGWVARMLQDAAINTAESSGYLAASAVPVIGPALTFQSIYAGESERISLESPNLSPGEVSQIAAPSALVQSALELVKLDILTGKLPVFSKMLKDMSLSKKGIVGQVGGFGKRWAAMSAAETGVEMTQNFVPILMDQLGAALSEDYKKHDFAKDFEAWQDSAPEMLATMMLMSLLGAGAAQVSDIRNGHYLVSTTLPLRMAGLSEEQAAKVIAEPTDAARQAKLEEEWKKRTRENIAEGVKIANAEAEKVRAKQQSVVTPTMEAVTQPDGATLYTARGADGRVILSTNDAEAAQAAIREENAAILKKSTSGVGEAASFISSVNQAIARGEDVQKLLTEQAPRTLLDEYNANPTPENLDRLFETVRFFGEEISEPSQLGKYFVKASNRGTIKEGIYRSIIRVHEGADATHVMRDFSQDNLKRAIAEGDVSLDWVRGQLAAMKGIKGFDGLRTDSDTDVIESFSDVALAYFHGRIKDSSVPGGLRTFLRQMAAIIRDIFVRSYRLRRAISAGEVGESFQQLLATSVGLDVDQIVAMEGEKAMRRMEREALDAINEGDGFQGDELLDVLKKAKLPDEKSPFWNEDFARIKEAVQEWNRGKTAKEKIKISDIFSNDAVDPDLNVVGALQENGFDFFTVDDMVQAVERRIVSGKPERGTKSNDALQGADYSIGKFSTLKELESSWDSRGIQNSVYEKDGIITLSKIIVDKDKRGEGIGTSAMQELLNYADSTGQQIALTPSSDFGGSKGRLEKFYRGLGFRKYNGFKVREKLIRDPQSRSNYSIGKAGENRVSAALEANLKRNPDARIALYERAKSKFDEVRERRGDSIDPNRKFASLLQSMGELDAILKVLPAEIRGKVGGYMPLANLGKDTIAGNREATIDKFLEKRIAMVGKALEKALRDEYGARMDRILDRARPAKDEAGKKRVGKLGNDIHALFDSIRAAMEMTPEEADAKISALEAEIAKGELTPEQEAHKSLEAGMIAQVADWENADAARRAGAVDSARSLFDRGYLQFAMKKGAIREARAISRGKLTTDAGTAGTPQERDKRAIADNAVLPGWRDVLIGLLNFEQATKWVFGDASQESQRLADMERKAANRKEDRTQAKMDAIADLFTNLAGGKFEGEKLRWNMAQKTMDVAGRKLSELEAISALLMWKQEDGQRHMLGRQDENGNYVSAWHYDQDFIDIIERDLSNEARAVMAFIAENYGKEWADLNPVYSELYGVNLPRHENYAPLTVVPLQVSGQTIDPVTGSTMSSGSPTPGSLRTRGTSTAEPDFRDALQTFIAHTRQMEHWMAYAPFVAEARAILGNRELGNSIEAKSGDQALRVVRGWLTYFEQGGTRDAAASLALSQGIGKAMNRAAAVAIVGRIGTLAIQLTQLAAASAEMPTGAYLSRLGKLFAGQLGWGQAMGSDYIQRRILQMPPAVQQAMDGLRAEKPSMLKHQVQKIGTLISGADGLFTAGTYAIVYDYQLARAAEMGLTGADAESYARNAAERSVDRVAQPTRPGARSLFENTSVSPFARLAWAFASESRKNLGLMTYAASTKDPVRFARAVMFAFVLNSVISELIRSAWRDARNGDDDEIFDERNWNPARLAMSVFTSPLQGLPVFGDMLEAGAFKASGQYLPEGNILSSGPRAISAVMRADNILAGEEDVSEILRDVDMILSGMGVFHSDIAAAASISHLVRDLYGVGENTVQSIEAPEK